MMARIRQQMAKEDKGFTLIELLVVMIIIGILAAIAIPVFMNQRKKAEDSAAKADVSTIGKEIATYYVDGSGSLPTVAKDGNGRWTLGGVDLGKASSNVELLAQQGTGATDWCVAVYNDDGDKTTKANSGVSYSAQNGMQVGVACPTAPTP